MIQINKQLQRPDKGMVSPGSLIYYTAQFIEEKKTIRFNLTHWFSLSAKETAADDGWQPIQKVKDFSYIQFKECTEEEWDALDESGSAALVKDWLKQIIESQIGAGNTEII